MGEFVRIAASGIVGDQLQAAQKLDDAVHDLWRPTVSVLGVVGEASVRDSHLPMYRKMFTSMICLMLLGTFFVPKGRADLSDRKTIVTFRQTI